MFEAKVKQNVLSDILDVPGALVEEAVLQFTEDQLLVRVPDKANVGMAHVSVPKEDFETYQTGGVNLGVILSKLSDVAEMSGEDNLVSFVLDEETRKLEIDAGDLHYTMGLIDPKSIETMDELPDLPFDANVTLATPEMNRAIKAADMVSDHVTLAVAGNDFYIEASGDSDGVDVEASDVKVEAGEDGTISNAEAMFSLEYLKDMFKTINSSYVRIGIADEMPVRIEFALENSEGRGVFVLAPRIDSS